MSEYCSVKTQFKDPQALIAALAETQGWTPDQIEFHEEAQNLYGYHGDLRPQKANIIIRRVNVGVASNDIGFEKQSDGTYVSHISQYDTHKYDTIWQNKLRCSYAFHAIRLSQEKRGRAVERVVVPGSARQRIIIRNIR